MPSNESTCIIYLIVKKCRKKSRQTAQVRFHGRFRCMFLPDPKGGWCFYQPIVTYKDFSNSKGYTHVHRDSVFLYLLNLTRIITGFIFFKLLIVYPRIVINIERVAFALTIPFFLVNIDPFSGESNQFRQSFTWI